MPLVASADDLIARLRATEAAFARDARRQRVRWRYRLDRRRIRFDREARAAHRRFRQSIAVFLRESTLTNALTAPLIYSLAVPLVLADAYHPVSVDLFPLVWHRTGAASRLFRRRPPQARIFECD